jgi:S-adenosylmethionine decarboxylase proenzyme
MESLGIHILAEYSKCDYSLINDVAYIEKIMLESASLSGASVVSSSFHRFSPHGVSGVVVIKESHMAIHTWPEYRFASVDIFTCGDTVDPWKAYEHLKKSLGAENGTAFKISRGTNLVAESYKIDN